MSPVVTRFDHIVGESEGELCLGEIAIVKKYKLISWVANTPLRLVIEESGRSDHES